MWNDGCDADAYLVSESEKDDEVPLEVVYHIHFHILECRRFCLSLRIVSAWRDDFHCLDGPPQQRSCQFPLRGAGFQGEESSQQDRGSPACHPWNGVPVSGLQIASSPEDNLTSEILFTSGAGYCLKFRNCETTLSGGR